MIPRDSGLLVVLSGPSGVGKGTVVARAMSARHERAARLRRSVSVTTRSPRPGEQDGADYFFVSPERFDELRDSGSLLEWATYLDACYGTPQEWLDQQLAAGYDVVLEIEVKGAMQVRERRPEAVLVYMLPPSWDDLAARLAGRGSDGEETQQRRIAVAHEEVEFVARYDYLIVNDDVDGAVGRFLAILEAEHLRIGRLDLSDLR